MEYSPAFLQAAPVLSNRQIAPVRRKICMADEPPASSPPENADKPKKPKKTIRTTATWANVFLPEFGRKGPGSRPDWDLRPMSVRTEEQGKGTCDSCKGTGMMTCSFCFGLDHVARDGTVAPCPACGKQKRVTCSACFGSKKQIEMVCFSLVLKHPNHPAFRLYIANFLWFYGCFHSCSVPKDWKLVGAWGRSVLQGLSTARFDTIYFLSCLLGLRVMCNILPHPSKQLIPNACYVVIVLRNMSYFFKGKNASKCLPTSHPVE